MFFQFESQTTSESKVILNHFFEIVHRAPPGHGSANVRNAIKSTLA
jgi:hypothetical protein